MRGNLKLFYKDNKVFIKCITKICNEETIDMFEIISSPCVYCGGITTNCDLCKGTDQVWVLKKDKK